jgi:hypothetical protein
MLNISTSSYNIGAMSTQTTSTAVEPQALDTPTLGEMQLKYPLVL